MVFYNKEINDLRMATKRCSSEVPKILLKFIEGIGDRGINLSKIEQDEIKCHVGILFQKPTRKRELYD